jgi:carboxymethylenebutenolidase
MGFDSSQMIDIDGFPAYLASPSGGEKCEKCKGGLIVVHEAWGLSDHIKDVTDRFAAEGYLALAPDLFSETGIYEKITSGLAEDLFNPEKRNEAQPKVRELMAPINEPGFAEETVNKLKACFNYLNDQATTNNKVAITGFCFGGTYSFSLAVEEPNLKAAAPFYGHSNHTVEELKQIKCPIMAFYGEKDERLIESLPDLKSRMSEAKVDFTAQVYPDCGHAFFNDTNRFAYNKAAAEDAWVKVLDFLASNL